MLNSTKLKQILSIAVALVMLVGTIAVTQTNAVYADSRKFTCTDCTLKIRGGHNEITISATPGPKGDKGDQGDASTVPGPKGDRGNDSTVAGPPGAPGKDGTTLSNETINSVNSVVQNEQKLTALANNAETFNTILDLFNNGSLTTSIVVENGTLTPVDNGTVIPPVDNGTVIPPVDNGTVIPPVDNGTVTNTTTSTNTTTTTDDGTTTSNSTSETSPVVGFTNWLASIIH